MSDPARLAEGEGRGHRTTTRGTHDGEASEAQVLRDITEHLRLRLQGEVVPLSVRSGPHRS